MHLTRHTDYALRVLMYLALEPDRVATISDIAGAYDISRNHLVKVVHELGGHGLLHTSRGKGGGIRLARPPDSITVGEVVRRMEGSLQIIDCASPRCAILPQCRLKGALEEAARAFLTTLDGYTLHDLVQQREPALLGLLGR
ncbi:Rrf2 family transcriptional regulator [Ectothiorhodospiraceae bacterium 2226]|nr:Rrf2 family transcriptional regulator [Ectothiorhodospiraceae bacterium 2226]